MDNKEKNNISDNKSKESSSVLKDDLKDLEFKNSDSKDQEINSNSYGNNEKSSESFNTKNISSESKDSIEQIQQTINISTESKDSDEQIQQTINISTESKDSHEENEGSNNVDSCISLIQEIESNLDSWDNNQVILESTNMDEVKQSLEETNNQVIELKNIEQVEEPTNIEQVEELKNIEKIVEPANIEKLIPLLDDNNQPIVDQNENDEVFDESEKNAIDYLNSFNLPVLYYEYLRELDFIDFELRSIYIGNLDFALTVNELWLLLRRAGVIVSIKIPLNKNNEPMGFAYAEFLTAEGAAKSLTYDGTVLFDREVKILRRKFHKLDESPKKKSKKNKKRRNNNKK